MSRSADEDFFYSPTMGRVRQTTMRDKYGALVPYAQTRYDLYIVGS